MLFFIGVLQCLPVFRYRELFVGGRFELLAHFRSTADILQE